MTTLLQLLTFYSRLPVEESSRFVDEADLCTRVLPGYLDPFVTATLATYTVERVAQRPGSGGRSGTGYVRLIFRLVGFPALAVAPRTEIALPSAYLQICGPTGPLFGIQRAGNQWKVDSTAFKTPPPLDSSSWSEALLYHLPKEFPGN